MVVDDFVCVVNNGEIFEDDVFEGWVEKVMVGCFVGKIVIVMGVVFGIGKVIVLCIVCEGGCVIVSDIVVEKFDVFKVEFLDVDIVMVVGDFIK